jgi:hypothetical protein
VEYLLRINDRRRLKAAVDRLPTSPTEVGWSKSSGDGLPRSPEEAYNKIMIELLSMKNVDDQPLRVLSWVFHSPKQLKMGELLDALIIEENDRTIDKKDRCNPEDIVEGCKSLVSYDEKTQIVRFSHFTVKEFLRRDYESTLSSSADLAKTCLFYIGLDEFDKPCSDQDSLEKRLEDYKFSQYASQLWGFHTRGEPEVSEEIQGVIFRILGAENKLKSITQINYYLDVNLGRKFTNPEKVKLFHALAFNGLAWLCNVLLEREREKIGQ